MGPPLRRRGQARGTDLRVHATTHARRRVVAAAQVAPPPPPPRRPHVLLDPAGGTDGPKATYPSGLSPVEIADRILMSLLSGTGPVLLCVPGTLGRSYETSMLSTARALVAQVGGAVSVASIPYHNSVPDVIKRFFKVGTSVDRSVFALVIRGLKRFAPERPILVTGESQGSWLIAQNFAADPELARAVTRVAIFSKPGFAATIPNVGQAAAGASMLPGPPGVQEWRHTDDIVPSLFSRLNCSVAQGYMEGISELVRNHDFEYYPHHYDLHGVEAATYLLTGVRPSNPVHDSHADR